MPTEMIKYIIDYWSKHPEMKTYAPFLNGEPLLDSRLPWINDYITEKTKAQIVIDTNATEYAARERLIHPNLRQVRVSLCAATKETYEKVHGANLFDKVIKTVEWFIENRHPTQSLSLHYMVNKYNEEEIPQFLEQWENHLIKLFPLHQMPGIQKNSEDALPSEEWINKTNTLEDWNRTRPLYIYPGGYRERRIMRSYMICQGMSFCIHYDGLILHCSDAPPKYNYGHVYDVDMLGAWRNRNRNRITNPACIACNAKRPDWYKSLKRYGLATDNEIKALK